MGGYSPVKTLLQVRYPMNKRPISFTPLLGSVIRLAVVSLALATPLLAQQNPPNPAPPTLDSRSELRDRDMNVTLLERGKDEARNRQSVLTQMNEDFARIQSADKDVLSAVSTEGAPDYKRISDGLADIRKRAIRLRDNLVLPPAGKDGKSQKTLDEADTNQLRPALVALNGLITSFVTNPLFQQGANVDYRQVAKARRDLDGIIDFSDKIRKSTEKLSKASSKPDQ